jgi:hypothetical protein
MYTIDRHIICELAHAVSGFSMEVRLCALATDNGGRVSGPSGLNTQSCLVFISNIQRRSPGSAGVALAV